MSAHSATAEGVPSSTMGWTVDELLVLADSCDRIAARCYDLGLGDEFGRLASTLRDDSVGYEEIQALVEACEIARRRDEADLGEEVDGQARLILLALRQMIIWKASDQGAFDPYAMRRSEKLFNAIAEWAENPGLDLYSSRHDLAVQFEDSIDRISAQNRVLMRSLNDYENELSSYRDWARKCVVR